MNKTDSEYFRLLNLVIDNGRVKKNRTGTDTIGIFGAQARFDLQEGFPLLTTKKVFFKAIAHELLWFIKGDTNIKYLVDNNVHIWDEWAYKKYCDFLKKHPDQTFEHNPHGDMGGNRWKNMTQQEFISQIKTDNNFALVWGELGEGTYGGMWRQFPYQDENRTGKPLDIYALPTHGDKEAKSVVGYVDQIAKLVDKLKNNPDDRRMIVSAWHPYWVDHCALPPCHALFQFHTEELTIEERINIACQGKDAAYVMSFLNAIPTNLKELNIPTRRLNCQLYQRSCDLFLGVPFNIASYALLTQMIAHVSNMAPGEFVHSYGDLHIYTNHLSQVKEQMIRRPFDKLPRVILNPEVKSLFDFTFNDITLEGYESHPAIKGEVAV